MKKLILRATLILAAFGITHAITGTDDALAAPTGCSPNGEARGTVCWYGTPPKLVTSCGGTKYIDGSVTNAGTLDDRCFAKYGKGQTDKAPYDKKPATPGARSAGQELATSDSTEAEPMAPVCTLPGCEARCGAGKCQSFSTTNTGCKYVCQIPQKPSEEN
jgi:hypothetical protein